ncbi:stage II sporulation protein M [Actinoalloteichus hymeniacidonis]|uniref:Stage II sporulation protein M n=1 Tax=Actinoalloteichus hymeniacidonis TaxID=340345 RepID=A0AAC9HR13_9PSEU|nr:stage II sporulation protein M [Actinoalloteichus hymeniacidonis]AOS63828.1 hypothetical protein TL08_15095 [Actinoalloteichus hymeniacidonis]MBB5908117.1 hypothetical protein [Actinoalloteichus hymeniacidonis]
MRSLRKSFQIIRSNLGAYLVLNAVVYGAFLIGIGVALLFPELTAQQLTDLQDDGTTDLVVSLLSNVWLFALVIFAVNTLTVGVLSILLPSMIVPFAGIAIFAYRAFDIGMTLAPTDDAVALTLIPHALTLLIEFQAYVLLTLGAYLLGRCWLRPDVVDARDRRQGYLRGLQQFGRLSLPALLLFVVGAIYEAFSLVYLVPLLFGA